MVADGSSGSHIDGERLETVNALDHIGIDRDGRRTASSLGTGPVPTAIPLSTVIEPTTGASCFGPRQVFCTADDSNGKAVFS
jgi:hypothetical protein